MCGQAQEVLLDTAWTDEALAFEQWKAILGKDATVAFRGPRIKMAVVQDIPTSIGPHPDTGCAMYHGPMAGRFGPLVLWTSVAIFMPPCIAIDTCYKFLLVLLM